MKAIIILLILVLVFFLIGQIRVGGRVEYSQEGVKAWLRIHGVPILLFPRPKKKPKPGDEEKAAEKKRRKAEKAAKKKAKKAKKGGEKKPETQEKPPEKKGGTVQLVLQLLPVVVEALGALKRRIRIDLLVVHYVAGGEDAAKTALTYGKVSGAAGVILALLNNNFKVKKQEVTMDVNFLAERATVYLDAALSIKIGQILYLGVRYGIACLRVFLRHRKEGQPAEKTNKTQAESENK